MPPGAKERPASLESVAARLAHAMHESHGPVDRMGAALERMMRALARAARALERLRAGDAAAGGFQASAAALDDLDECREALERDIAACIESLQFHDRLMQHLAHVCGGLGAIAGKPHSTGGDPRKSDLGAGSVELF
ncbi:MAG: hypothetical protein ACREUT_12045 [Steroidobacteraceae bacterium]